MENCHLYLDAYTLNAHIHPPCTHTHAHTHMCTHTYTHNTHIGLAGSDDIENGQIWGYVDEVTNLLEKVFKGFFEKDDVKKVRVHSHTMQSLLDT